MALSDISHDRYDQYGYRHWRLKSNPSMKCNDIYEKGVINKYINMQSAQTKCPLDRRTCNYKMIIPSDPTKGYIMRWCRHKHNFKFTTKPPCGLEFE